MKKFLLLIAALSAFCTANAIELTFWLGNKKIAANETVKFTDVKVDTYEGYKEVTMKPQLYLSADIYSSDIKITANCTSGQLIQMCAGGTCRGGVTVTKEEVVVQTNQKLDLGFDCITEVDLDQAIPTVVTVIEAEDVTESGSKKQFIIEMSGNSASISSLEKSDDIKPVAGGLAYNTETATALTVTNITGRNVFSSTVSGAGYVALPKGLYIYSFGGRTGKIYIR